MNKRNTDWLEQVRVQERGIEAFADFAQRCMTQRTSVNRRNVSVMALTLKAVWTARSIRLLANAGHYADAIALSRVLIENAINAAYLHEQTVRLYWDFAPVETWNWLFQVKDSDDPIVRSIGDEFIARNHANYEAVKDEYPGKDGRKNWTNTSLYERALAVDKAGGNGMFAHSFNHYWRKSNAFVHSTASALYPYCHGEGTVFHIKPPERSSEEEAKVLSEAAVGMMIVAATADLLFGGAHGQEFSAIRQDWYDNSADIRLDVEDR